MRAHKVAEEKLKTHTLITDLRRQKELLELLISEFKRREFLTQEDLNSYDRTTQKTRKKFTIFAGLHS